MIFIVTQRSMDTRAYHILRVALGVTFVWIGLTIWKAPEAWFGFLQEWAKAFIVGDPITIMKTTAIFDIAVGLLLLVNVFPRVVSAIGALHLAGVIIGIGFNDIAARDLGLLGGMVALLLMAKERGWKVRR